MDDQGGKVRGEFVDEGWREKGEKQNERNEGSIPRNEPEEAVSILSALNAVL